MNAAKSAWRLQAITRAIMQTGTRLACLRRRPCLPAAARRQCAHRPSLSVLPVTCPGRGRPDTAPHRADLGLEMPLATQRKNRSRAVAEPAACPHDGLGPTPSSSGYSGADNKGIHVQTWHWLGPQHHCRRCALLLCKPSHPIVLSNNCRKLLPENKYVRTPRYLTVRNPGGYNDRKEISYRCAGYAYSLPF